MSINAGYRRLAKDIASGDDPRVLQSEAEFQREVVTLAEALGWLVYHTYDSRRSNPGFPDLILIKRDVMIVAELKALKGTLSREQVRWLDSFRATKSKMVAEWRPTDWVAIEQALKGVA